jgi:hypothetical protein
MASLPSCCSWPCTSPACGLFIAYESNHHVDPEKHDAGATTSLHYHFNQRKLRQIRVLSRLAITFASQKAPQLCDPADCLPQRWREMRRLVDRAGERLPFVVHQDLHTCHLFILTRFAGQPQQLPRNSTIDGQCALQPFGGCQVQPFDPTAAFNLESAQSVTWCCASARSGARRPRSLRPQRGHHDSQSVVMPGGGGSSSATITCPGMCSDAAQPLVCCGGLRQTPVQRMVSWALRAGRSLR